MTLATIYLHSYEAKFIQYLLPTGKNLASQFNFTYKHIDDVLSINNRDFDNYLGQMYLAVLEIKDKTANNTLCFLLGFTPVDREGRSVAHFPLRRTWPFQIPYCTFSFLSSNILSSPAYGIFISQLIRYARACSSYECFILMAARYHLRSSDKDMSGNIWNRSFWSIFGSHQTLWSIPLPNVTWYSGTWLYKVTPSIDQTLHQFVN